MAAICFSYRASEVSISTNTRLHITSRKRHTHESDWVELIMTSDQNFAGGKPAFEQKNHSHFLLIGTCLQSALINRKIKIETKELLCQKLE